MIPSSICMEIQTTAFYEECFLTEAENNHLHLYQGD